MVAARRRPLLDRSTPETRAERIKNMEDLVFEALRDARIATTTPALNDKAQESATRLRNEIARRETLLHLEELSNSSVRRARDKYQDLSRKRMRTLRTLRQELADALSIIRASQSPEVPSTITPRYKDPQT